MGNEYHGKFHKIDIVLKNHQIYYIDEHFLMECSVFSYYVMPEGVCFYNNNLLHYIITYFAVHGANFQRNVHFVNRLISFM